MKALLRVTQQGSPVLAWESDLPDLNSALLKETSEVPVLTGAA